MCVSLSFRTEGKQPAHCVCDTGRRILYCFCSKSSAALSSDAHVFCRSNDLQEPNPCSMTRTRSTLPLLSLLCCWHEARWRRGGCGRSVAAALGNSREQRNPMPMNGLLDCESGQSLLSDAPAASRAAMSLLLQEVYRLFSVIVSDWCLSFPALLPPSFPS